MAAYKELNDIELVKMLQEAEGISNPAFEELYNRFWHKLFAVALHRLGSHDEAEEVVQEVFYNLWKRRTSLQLTASPATYLATAVKYEIINRLAKIERGAKYIRYAGNTEPTADNSTQEWLHFEELQSVIAHSVKALPEKCRLVYQLSRDKGYTEKQIASELNISVKTVEAHLTKAIKTLRSSLKHFFSFI
jgi:RNA polymerase sigma-70 factor (family 1)